MAIANDKPDINDEDARNDDYWLKFIDDGYNDAKNQRITKVERQWFLNYIWFRGMKVRYNKLSKQLVADESSDQKFYVNKIQSNIRAIRNFVTQYRPVWDVDARPYGSLPREITTSLGDFLDYQYDRLNMREKNREAVLFGMLYSIGIYMYGWDKDAQEGLGDVWVDVLDPFDVYVDPLAGSIDDARWVIRVVKKPVELLQNNPAYDQEKTKQLSEDNKHSASDYKNQLANATYGTTYTSAKAEDGTVLIYETWIKDVENGKTVIRVVTKAGNHIIRNEVTPYEELPFVVYKSDTMPGELYGEGAVKHLIPLNKQLNDLERSMAEYHQVMSKGRYLEDKNSGVKTITNETGQRIKKNPGTSVQELPMGNYSASGIKQIENMLAYMEDISGISDTFRGQVPTQMSGVAIEQLIAASGNNLREYTEHLEDALAKLGECVLKLASKYYDEARAVKKNARGEEASMFQVIGEQALDDPENPREAPEDVVIIPYNSEVSVKISSGLGYTKEAKQERAQILRGQGDLSRATLLEEMGLNPEAEQQKIDAEKVQDAETQIGIDTMMMQAQQAMMPPVPMEGEMPIDPAMMESLIA